MTTTGPRPPPRLGDDRWLALTDAHARLYRGEECAPGRAIRQADERNYISDADLSRMLAYIELLGLPRDQAMTITRDGQEVEVAGFGQPAMMRAWLIQALTGRRASEVLLMDFDPLSHIPGVDPAAVPEGGMVARLRYQQTKIDGAPDTILVGADVVQIIRRAAGLGAAALGARAGRDGAVPVPQADREPQGHPGLGDQPLRPGAPRSSARRSGCVTPPGGRCSTPAATGCVTPRPRPCSTPAPRSTSCSATSVIAHPR